MEIHRVRGLTNNGLDPLFVRIYLGENHVNGVVSLA